MFQPEEIEVSDVYHLPIIKAFADRLDLVNIINRLVPSNMEIVPGNPGLGHGAPMPFRVVIPSIALIASTIARTSNYCWANPLMLKSSVMITSAGCSIFSTRPIPRICFQRLP